MSFYDELITAGLSVTYADETGLVIGQFTVNQMETLESIAMQYFRPTEYADLQQWKTDIQALKSVYTDMITRLEQIQAASNPTNAQVIQAVKDLALYQERVMKFLRRMET